jgi:hypothetical protein
MYSFSPKEIALQNGIRVDMDYPKDLLEGLAKADEILRVHNTAGFLCGSALPRLFCGMTSKVPFYDIDVLIPSMNCEHHPRQGKGSEYGSGNVPRGIDWWITHRPDERPTNDNWEAMAQVLGGWAFDEFIFNNSLKSPTFEAAEQIYLYWSIIFREPQHWSGLCVPHPLLANTLLRGELAQASTHRRNKSTWDRRHIEKLEKYLGLNWDPNSYNLPYPLIQGKDVKITFLPKEALAAKYCKTTYTDRL